MKDKNTPNDSNGNSMNADFDNSWKAIKAKYMNCFIQASNSDLIQFGYIVAEQLCETEEGWKFISERCPYYNSLVKCINRRSTATSTVLTREHFVDVKRVNDIHTALRAIIDYHDNMMRYDLGSNDESGKTMLRNFRERLERCTRSLRSHMIEQPTTLVQRYIQRCDGILRLLCEKLSI